jgi:hypothetical protein
MIGEECVCRLKCETEMNLNKVSIEIYEDDIEVLIQQVKMTLLGCGYTEGTLKKYFLE